MASGNLDGSIALWEPQDIKHEDTLQGYDCTTSLCDAQVCWLSLTFGDGDFCNQAHLRRHTIAICSGEASIHHACFNLCRRPCTGEKLCTQYTSQLLHACFQVLWDTVSATALRRCGVVALLVCEPVQIKIVLQTVRCVSAGI